MNFMIIILSNFYKYHALLPKIMDKLDPVVYIYKMARLSMF